ncbi:MAG: hypothetical protein AAB692_05140, partial [Patescibacteria group bacterium]
MDSMEKQEAVPQTEIRKNSRNLFCLPAWMAKGKEMALAGAGLRPRFKQANFDGFTIDVCLLSTGRQNYDLVVALAKVIAGYSEKEEWQTTSCLIGHRYFDVHYPMRNLVTLVDMDKLDDRDRKELGMTYVLAAAHLRRLASLSGLHIHFHANGGFPKAPQPDREGHIHIYTFSRPPGDGILKFVDTAFGIDLRTGEKQRVGYEPAAGRGYVLEDEKGPLIQVVGSNFYFLIPVISDTFAARQMQVFELMTKLAWDGLRTKPTKKKPVRRFRPGALKEMAQKWMKAAADHIDKEIARCNADLDVHRQKMAQLYRFMREYEAIRQSLSRSDVVKETIERMPSDLRRIKVHPDVVSMEMVEEGLHVGTRQIVIEHAGRRYPVGEFTVRINRYGHISVWNEKPTHPKNESHPHINDDGTPCFGNATDAI